MTYVLPALVEQMMGLQGSFLQQEAACTQSLLFLQPIAIRANLRQGDCYSEPRIVFWFIDVFLNRKKTRLQMERKKGVTENLM